jgi:hypothetical protein
MGDLDDWDSLAFDPHRQEIQAGVKDGQEAGRSAGFKDGRALGQEKGVEYGMELGFIRGVVMVLSEDGCRRDEEKIQKSLCELNALLDEFPTPDEMFDKDKTDQDGNHGSKEEDSSSILHHMQRIRARFKLLMVQLKEPHFSLKQVMTDAANMDQEPAVDREW